MEVRGCSLNRPPGTGSRTGGERKESGTIRCAALFRPVLRWIALLTLFAQALPAFTADRTIVLLAGKPSHGPGDHEFRAGCLLLKQCLDTIPGVTTQVYSNGWPAEAKALESADAILIYADGGGDHPALHPERLQLLEALVRKGVGVGCAHYGVEVPKGDPGAALHRWIGGHYEHQYSVNPMWRPDFRSFPDHPVTRGVKPFALIDEWYFNMRWPGEQKGITPILVAKPSDAVRNGPYVYPPGPYTHIQEARGREETMMWVFERPDGGRGFGFTGGHKHVNWANDNFRKVVLNGLLWIAKVEVPANGVSTMVSPEDLGRNLDPKGQTATAASVLTGTWKFTVETPMGSGTPTFRLIQAGNNLLGHYTGRLGEADVFGSVKGQDLRLSFTVPIEGEDRELFYTGSLLEDGTLKGIVRLGEFEGTWTATR